MRYLPFLLIVGLSLACASSVAQAAELNIEQIGNTNTVRVSLDTRGEVVNAAEGTLRFSGMVRSVSLGASVFPLWLERPTTSTLSFSGVVPGGYQGTNGTLFTMQLEGNGTFTFSPELVQVYRNDGLGSLVTTTVRTQPIQLAPHDAVVALDTQLPDFSEVRIARDPAVFDNEWFVLFNGQDADSGIARFEVAERSGSRTDALGDLVWQTAESPHILADQSRGSTVFVKAIDNEGNERISSVPPALAAPVNRAAILGGIALLLLFIGSLIVWRRARVVPLR